MDKNTSPKSTQKEKDPNQIIIKHKDLPKVLEDCNFHIGKLLQKSTDYFNKGDYPLSIVICIIAIEEIGKFAVFGEYQRKLKDVPRSEMIKLTKHDYKLTHFLESERLREVNLTKKRNKKNTIKQINKAAEEQKEVFRKLNIVKQLGLYYNYDKGTTITLETQFMKNEITKNNLAHFCLVLHELAAYNHNLESLRMHCGTIDGYIDENSDIVKQNKDYQRVKKFAEKIKTPKYQASLRKFQSTMLELEKLVDYLD